MTYRVYDYDRVGADGRPRPLHVEKALEVTDLHPVGAMDFGPHLGECGCFAVDGYDGPFTARCGPGSFHALLVTEGEGRWICGGEARTIRKGECLFLPAGSGGYAVEGGCKVLVTYVP